MSEITFDQLLSKPRRTRTILVGLPGQDSEQTEFVLQAVSRARYDEIIATSRPTKEQRDRGAVFNIDIAAPRLLAECLVSPLQIDEDQAKQLWSSDAWSAGELGDLTRAVLDVNSDGFDVPFNVSD